MIDEDVKGELIQSLADVLDIVAYDSKEYSIKARRQNQAVRITYPSVLIWFLESEPTHAFLGHRIGTYTDSEDNKIPLKGWVEKQRVRIECRAKDRPEHGFAQGEGMASFMSNTIKDYILRRWDIDILASKGMSLDEPVGGIKYISESTGPEYCHCSAFECNITYNFYWPRFSTPSITVKAEIFEIGLKEVGDTEDPTYFTIPDD